MSLQFAIFYGLRRFVTVFTRAKLRTKLEHSPLRSTSPRFIYLRCTSVLFSHVSLDFSRWSFSLNITVKIVLAFLISPTSGTYPAFLYLFSSQLDEGLLHLRMSLLYIFIHPPVTSSFLGSNIHYSILFSVALKFTFSSLLRQNRPQNPTVIRNTCKHSITYFY
jgi:multisubunit Na+/H+ antiporter MnhG subunit